MPPLNHPPTRFSIVLALALTATPWALAQTSLNWSNNSDVSTPFVTAGNWSGGIAPADDLTTNLGSFGTPAQTVTFSANRSVAGLTLTSGAGALVFAGNNSAVLTLGAAGITAGSNTAAPQFAASLFLALGASATFTSSGSTNITYNSPIAMAGFGLTLGGAGSGVSNINGIISGTGGLTKTGAADWRLLGVNTYGGGTTVNQAVLHVNGTGTTLPAGGNVTINGTVAGTSTVQIGSSAAQSIGTLTFGGAGANSSATNTLQLNAGTTTLGGTVTYDATNNPLGAAISGAGTLALGGNRTFAIANSSITFDLTVNSNISGSGNSLTKTGAGALSLRGANTYTGGTVVSAGHLYVSNTTGSGTGTGTVVIQTGAQLRGNGFISGATTIESGANLGPGPTNTPGTLTFTGGLSLLAGSSVGFQLGTVSSDKISVLGGVLSGPSSGTITLNLFSPSDTTSSGAFAAGTYTLFNFATGGTTTSSFDVADFALGSTISGYTYNLAFNGSTLELTATASAIPEPSTYAAIFGGLALVGAVWHRRRQGAPADKLNDA